MKPLPFIFQIEHTECGVSCVAMLARTSRRRARQAFSSLKSDDLRTYSSDVREALQVFNIRLGRGVVSSSWSALQGRSIRALVAVNVRRKRKCFFWHWVVFDGARRKAPILDPFYFSPRADTNSLRIFFYHLVHYNET